MTFGDILIMAAVYILVWVIYWLLIPAVLLGVLICSSGIDIAKVPANIVSETKKHYPLQYKGIPVRHEAYVTYDIWKQIVRNYKNGRNS